LEIEASCCSRRRIALSMRSISGADAAGGGGFDRAFIVLMVLYTIKNFVERRFVRFEVHFCHPIRNPKMSDFP
jgi:hypothetical protein